MKPRPKVLQREERGPAFPLYVSSCRWHFEDIPDGDSGCMEVDGHDVEDDLMELQLRTWIIPSRRNEYRFGVSLARCLFCQPHPKTTALLLKK